MSARRTSVTLVLGTLLAVSAAEEGWVSFDGTASTTPPTVDILSASPTHITLHIATHGMYVRDTTVGDTVYSILTLPGESSTSETGLPRLPEVARLLGSACYSVVSAEVTCESEVQLDGYLVCPFQPSVQMGSEPDTFYLDSAFYDTTSHYAGPGGPACGDAVGIWRDLQVVSAAVRPIQYDPAARTLSAYCSVTATFYFGSGDPLPSSVTPSLHRAYGSSLCNYSYLGIEPDGNYGEPRLCLYIPEDGAQGIQLALKPYVTWKRLLGYIVSFQVVGPSWPHIPPDPAAIKQNIQTRYDAARVAHCDFYVALFGRDGDIPVPRGWRKSNPDVQYTWSDHWYACVGGSDDIPDLGLGRLPDDPQVVADKVLQYERDQNPGWPVHRALLVNDQYHPWGHDLITSYMDEQNLPYAWQDGSREGVDNQSLRDAVEEGCGVLGYFGHGGHIDYGNDDIWQEWCLPMQTFSNAQIGALQNPSYLPMVYEVSCYQGDCGSEGSQHFNHSWAWCAASGGGGVASWGFPRTSWTREAERLSFNLLKWPTWGRVTETWLVTVGAKEDMRRVHRTEHADDNYRMLSLVGDPTLHVYAADSGELQVDVEPAALQKGQNSTVHVWVTNDVPPHGPVEGVMVGFYKEGEVFASRATDANGHASASVCPATSGRVDITAFRPNYRTGKFQCKVYGLPIGIIDALVPGGRSDVPVVMFNLITEEPAPDSVRLVQSFYGADTALPTTDTTQWIPCAEYLSWQFLHGEGKYRFLCQHKDTLGNMSPFYPASFDTVVFDSTPPVGTLVVNEDEYWTTQPGALVRTEVADSLSGVPEMRLGNRELANVVRNSRFVELDGGWEFSGGGFGSGLEMGEVEVIPDQAAWLRQFIPAESLAPFWGQQLRLSGDLQVLLQDSWPSTPGMLEFGYWYTWVDTAQHDTLWESIVSEPFNGPACCRVGLDRFQQQFQLGEPSPDPNRVWQGGYLRAWTYGLGGVAGRVWLDNLKLEPYGMMPDYGWWQPYDSLVSWELGWEPGRKLVRAAFRDEAGNESWQPATDEICLDNWLPDVYIEQPWPGSWVNGQVSILGWSYDPVTPAGDTWFEWRRLQYRHVDSLDWQGVGPDSVCSEPAYPDWEDPFTPAVELAVWDTDSLPDGQYWLLLSAADSAGNELGFTSWVYVCHTTTTDVSAGGPGGGGSNLTNGSVFVGSGTGRVLHLDEDLVPVDSFALGDSGTVSALLGVGQDSLLAAVDGSRRVYKADRQGRGRRLLLQNSGRLSGLARDDNGNIWACDRTRGLLGRFSGAGQPLLVRGQGMLDSPEAVCCHADLVYVADAGNDRIAVWDTAGNWVGAIEGDFASPQALAVTDTARIFVVDGTDGSLWGLNRKGGRYVTIGSNGGGLQGLCLSANGRHAFTLQPRDNLVLKYRLQSDDSLPGGGAQSGGVTGLPNRHVLYQPWPNPARTVVHVDYAVPRKSEVRVGVYDILGRCVRVLARGEHAAGRYRLNWNRADDAGKAVAAGVYFCRLVTPGCEQVRKTVVAR